jgi:AraC-like DNA-binding protein
MDALSDVLRAVRLTGAVFFDVQAAKPWVAETPPGQSIVARIFPDSDHLIPYHVVTTGGCWGGLIGEAPVRLSAGDVVMFPHGDAHVLSSEPGMRSVPDLTLYRRPIDGQLPFAISMGARDAEAPESLVCGYLACDARPFNPLLAALPRIIHVTDRDGGAIGAFVRFAVTEFKERRPGGEAVLEHLSELMFVDVVRRYLETLPADRTDWLAALREPFVGRALTALHRSPARAWTLELLAHEVGLSRSALAERFTAFAGQPPMQYLTNWRMQLAANDLRSGTDTVSTIADRVGYESEAAFSRAFKKAVGVSPTDWRRRSSVDRVRASAG